MMKFIFKIKIKKGHSEQEYIEAWRKGSTIIQASEGAMGTIIYRKIDEPRTLIAIATWKSKKARDMAMKKLDQASLQIVKILNKHNEYGNTEVVGSFEEINRIELK